MHFEGKFDHFSSQFSESNIKLSDKIYIENCLIVYMERHSLKKVCLM